MAKGQRFRRNFLKPSAKGHNKQKLTWLQNEVSGSDVAFIVDFKFLDVVVGVDVVAVDAVRDRPGDARRKLDRPLKFPDRQLSQG